MAAAATAILLAGGEATAATEAEALFDEGKRLMAEGKIAEACRSFEASFASDPLGGTLLGLAICHEKEGRLATSLREFERAAEMAAAAGRSDRVGHARGAIEDLRPRVPRLVIAPPREGRPPGLVIRVDGVVLPEAEWNVDLLVDPGPRGIEWTASDGSRGTVSVVAREGSRETVVVGTKARANDVATGSPSTEPRAAAPEAEPASDGLAPTQVAALVTGGAGLAALGTGAVLGILALGKSSDADAACDPGGEPIQCSPEGLAAFESGRDLALGADLTLGAGLLLVGASVTLFLWPVDEPSTASRTSPWIRGVAGPDRAGLATGGTF